MALTDKLTTIADAIRGKTGKTEALTLDAMALAIAGIEAGGGGSMEMGELTATTANYYDLTIPVSSKKTHLLILPKQYGALIADPTTGGYVERRICILLAVAGEGMTEISVLNQYNAGQGLNRGDCYHYSAIENSQGKATFNDTAITVKIAYSPFNPGEYYWFAW